jgi:hypothetical protein
MNDPFIILKTKRSKDSVIFRNYVYNWNRTNKNTVYFKCKTHGCKECFRSDQIHIIHINAYIILLTSL